MLFGDKQDLALECELEDWESDSPKDVFGHITFWAGGFLVGDFSVLVMLNIPYIHFRNSFQQCGKRQNPSLINMSAIEAFNFLESVLYGNSIEELLSYTELEDEFRKICMIQSDIEEFDKVQIFLEELAEKYSKYDVCTNFSEAFDEVKCLLIEGKKEERFIWKDYKSDSIREIILKPDTYKHVLESFITWFEQIKT